MFVIVFNMCFKYILLAACNHTLGNGGASWDNNLKDVFNCVLVELSKVISQVSLKDTVIIII